MNFKPGEPIGLMIVQSLIKGARRKYPCWPTGVEPMTLRILVQMLYHSATGHSRELRLIELRSCDKHPAYF